MRIRKSAAGILTLWAAWLLLDVGAGAVTQVVTSAGIGGGDGGSIPACTFYVPTDAARDAAQNTYIADSANHVIRRVDALGTVSTFAGTFGVAGTLDGNGTAARFNSPKSVVVDAAGTTLFVADTNNHSIRKIVLATGAVSTVAGRGGVSGFINGNTTNARFYMPSDLAVDATGNTLFVADTGNHCIRVIYCKNPINTVIASFAGTNQGYLNGNGTSAKFNAPCGVVLEPAGNTLYVADTNNHVIRQIATFGSKTVTTVTGQPALPGYAEGDSTTAVFNFPRSLVVNAANNLLYVSDTANHTLRRIDLASPGKTTAFVAGVAGNTGNADSSDGTGATAQFNLPMGLALDGTDIYVADSKNDAIRKITLAAGEVTTWAGGPGDGRTIPNCSFRLPSRLCRDAAGNQYITDADNHTIRKIAANGLVSTFAGQTGISGSVNGTSLTARFNLPKGIALFGTTLYVSDSENHTLRTIDTTTGMVALLAGAAGVTGTSNAPARFFNPQGLAVSPSGQFLYVADTNNHCIRRVDLTGNTVTTVFGSTSRASGFINALGTSARFNAPADLAIDAAGNTLYVADSGNHVIRGINLSTGLVSTVIGAEANLSNPQGVTVGDGFIFFSDASKNNLFIFDPIRHFAVKLAGLETAGMADGNFGSALFNFPMGLAYAQGQLFVADAFNRRIRRLDSLFEVRDIQLTPVLNNIFIASAPTQQVLQIAPTISGQDTLQAITVSNLAGTAVAPGDIKAVTAWFQASGGVFNPETAVRLGALTLTGDNHTWSSGPGAYNQLMYQNAAIYITVDISEVPTASRTCQFGVPAGGLVFASGTWPAAPVVNTFYQTLAPADVTFAIYHENLLPATVVKGQARVEALKFQFTNALHFDLTISALKLNLEDRDGNSLAAAAALSNVRAEGENGAVYSTLSLPAGPESSFVLNFSTPVNVPGGKSVVLKITSDINSAATAESFRFKLASASAVNQGTVKCMAAANDATGFPMVSDYAHVEKADLSESYSNYPNPFQPPKQVTHIKYYLKKPATVQVTLWTLTEDKVLNFITDEQQGVGFYRKDWDGKNGQGLLVQNGVYLCRLWLRYTDGTQELITRKIAVVR